MRINAKDRKTFKATALALNAAKQSVKTSKQHMTALSMGNEPEPPGRTISLCRSNKIFRWKRDSLNGTVTCNIKEKIYS